MDGSNGIKFVARVLRKDVRSTQLCRTWNRTFTSSPTPSALLWMHCDVRGVELSQPSPPVIYSRSRHRKLINFRVPKEIAASQRDCFYEVTSSGSSSASFDRFDSSFGADHRAWYGLPVSRRNGYFFNRWRNIEVIGRPILNGLSRHSWFRCTEDPCIRYDRFYSRGRSTNSRHVEMDDDATTAGEFPSTAVGSNRAKASRYLYVQHKAGEDRHTGGSSSRRWEGKVRSDNELLIAGYNPLASRKRRDEGELHSAVSDGQTLSFTSSAVTTQDIPNLEIEMDDQASKSASAQAMSLLRAALDEAEDEQGVIPKEFQRSLCVGVVGAPNAGKSLLTNQLVGTRVSAVSPKTNTTHRDHLGVYTKDETQLLYYDTPGLHLAVEGTPLRVDVQHRVRTAWDVVDFCDALVVLIDAERQIRRPDKRVLRLVEKLGSDRTASQKRVLCLNKVDVIEQKRQLLPLAKQFEDLLGFERIFMISGKTGSGVGDVTDYLVDQAVLRPWESDPHQTDQRDVSLEVVREQVFDKLHEELPHTTKQKLVSWKVLKDGSIRIQQLLLVPKKEHQKILVGTNGAVIGEIGIKARKELQQILGTTVHLVLDVKPMSV